MAGLENIKNIKNIKNISEAISWTGELFESHPDLFYGHGSDNPWDEALYLVLDQAGEDLELFFSEDKTAQEEILNKNLSPEIINQINKLIDLRVNQKIPLPYLINKAYFAGLEFYIDQRAIIPRSPIAELIETGFNLSLEGAEDFDFCKVSEVLDLCCGSGCIGIAAAVYYDFLNIDLLDIDSKALELAEINIKKYDLDHRVKIINSDLFSNFSNLNNPKKYDLILCNPPYVNQQDFESMPQEFSHEPELALISGQDGLDLTRKILSQAGNYLSDQGVLILEVGNSAEALEQAYPEIDFLWFEFERGGVGVCAVTKKMLDRL